MGNTKINEEVQKAVLDFTNFLASMNETKELNTAQMSGDDLSDEEIKISVRDYIKRSTARGVKRP